MEHAKRLAPSSAHMWGAPDGCRGSSQMIAKVPAQPDSPETLEGTATHAIGEQLLLAIKMGVPTLDVSPWIGMRDKETGLLYDADMVDAAEFYADAVYSVVRDRSADERMWLRIEERVYAPGINAECWGTPDAVFFEFLDNGRVRMHVFDLKYGFVTVDPFENWQLLIYAIGSWFQFLSENGWVNEAESEIVLHIVQPRKFHREGPHRSWTFNASLLRNYQNQLEYAATETLAPGATLRAGKHCKYCPARVRCPEYLENVAHALEFDATAEPVDREPQTLAAELGYIDDALTTLNSMRNALDAELTEHLKHKGAQVTGYELQPTYGRLTWSKEYDEMLALAKLFGIDLRQNKTITPNQARKLGLSDEIIEAYSHTPRKGLVLQRADLSLAKRVFSK